MKLVIKPIRLEAGRPIAFIHKNFAERFNIHEGDRVELLYRNRILITVTNILEKFIKKNEIALSNEALAALDTAIGEKLELSLVPEPISASFIVKKMAGHTLTKEEITTIINDIVNNTLNEAEIAYFVSSVYHAGMSLKETEHLIRAIVNTGKKLSWHRKKIADKHSIGGVAGNRTTPIVVSIAAAAGIIIPKTSSRAITSAAGTADVIETLANVSLSLTELRDIVKKTNACLAWGGTLGLAPADDRLIRIERFLNIDPESQLIASILAKKIAAGSTHILLDIPAGNGAKVSLREAQKLREKFHILGKRFNLTLKIVITDGTQPIGNGIGPALEMRDVLRVLTRTNPPRDLEEKSLFLAGIILEMMQKAPRNRGKEYAQKILDSGAAYKKFEEIICAQGKKRSLLKPAKLTYIVGAQKNAQIASINNKHINLLARILGCPTTPSAGIYIHKKRGDLVKKGEPILTFYAESPIKLTEAKKRFLLLNSVVYSTKKR